MVAEDVVLWHEADGVATLTLNRPERLNAWTEAMEARYLDLLQRAAETPRVRAVVVTGAGRGFCPGLDMDLLAGAATGGPGWAQAQAYARDLAANCSPASMAAIKAQIYGAWHTSLEVAAGEAIRLAVESLDGPDFVEGVGSYVEGRPPAFPPLGQGTSFTSTPQP